MGPRPRHAPPLRLPRRRALGLIAAGTAGAACARLVGPEDPPPVESPQLVSVMVEYRQPAGCLTAPSAGCADAVVFFASWLRPGAEFPLVPVGDGLLWRGVAEAVPVNYPPRDEPYRVRVFDPFLRGSPTGGITANRITVGGEFLTVFADVGEPEESALVYIDEDGRGHNAA